MFSGTLQFATLARAIPTSFDFVGTLTGLLRNLLTSRTLDGVVIGLWSAKTNANLLRALINSVIYDTIYNKVVNNIHTRHKVRL